MKKVSILVSLMALVFTSCLKDENITDKKYGTEGIGEGRLVHFPAATATKTMGNSNVDTTFTLLTVRLAETNTAAEDIQVTLTPNNTLVTGAGYKVAPSSAYTLSNPNLVVTIPKGQREGSLNITTKPSSLLGSTHALGYTISSVSNPSYVIMGNGKNYLAILPVKNAYDGIYSVESGFVQRYTAPGSPEPLGGLNGNLKGNPDVILSTIDATSVSVPPSSAASGAFYWAFGANSKVAGVDGIKITVDPATNLVTMSSSGNATLANWEGKENRYDPATKTFYLNFRWNPTSTRREYSVVLKYKKAR